MSTNHEQIWSTLFALCKEFKTALSSISDLEVQNFDAVSEIAELPDRDMIGITELSRTEDPLVTIEASFVCSTWEDANLFRLTKIVGHVKDRLKTDARFTLFRPDTLTAAGNLVVMGGTTVMPVMRSSKHRAVQAVAVTFGESAPGIR